MIVISDTSPITNLAAIGKLPILQGLYEYIVIPAKVYGEMVGIGKVVPGTTEIQEFSWIKTQEVINQQQILDICDGRENIDLGEAAAIVLALETRARVLLMDEKRGRAIAAEYGLNVVGLLGVLLQAKGQNLIPAVKPVIDELIAKANFRVSSQLYEMVVKTAEE